MKKDRLEEIRAEHEKAGEMDSYDIDHGAWERSKELLAEVDRLRGVIWTARSLLAKSPPQLAVAETFTLFFATVDLEDA